MQNSHSHESKIVFTMEDKLKKTTTIYVCSQNTSNE